MAEMTIKDKVDRILGMQERLATELRSLQSVCPHTSKTGKYGADKGNYYDPHDHDYWIEVNCPDCTKSWTIYYTDNPCDYYKFDGVKIK